MKLRTIASKSLPIHVAAKGGQFEVLKYLIEEKRADPTLEDKNCEDALTIAIKSKQQGVGQYLINLQRFDLDKTNKRSGFKYFSYAVVKGQLMVAKAIMQQALAKGR